MKAKFFYPVITVVIFGFLAACNTKTEQKEQSNDYMELATLYQQTAAEYTALCYQAFNIADIMVHDALNRKLGGKLAIITDIDETVLDNSPYQAKCILEGIHYPEQWDDWCNLATARAVPGAPQFFNYVADNGIEVFYITNRKSHLKEATLTNLKRQGFPFADDAHILMREKDNTKEPRRKLVEGKYRILMLLGDNLDDFTNAFENEPMESRKELVARLKGSFGRRFIVFPNAMYGSWVTTLYNESDSLGLKTQEETRRHFLTSFPSAK